MAKVTFDIGNMINLFIENLSIKATETGLPSIVKFSMTPIPKKNDIHYWNNILASSKIVHYTNLKN